MSNLSSTSLVCLALLKMLELYSFVTVSFLSQNIGAFFLQPQQAAWSTVFIFCSFMIGKPVGYFATREIQRRFPSISPYQVVEFSFFCNGLLNLVLPCIPAWHEFGFTLILVIRFLQGIVTASTIPGIFPIITAQKYGYGLTNLVVSGYGLSGILSAYVIQSCAYMTDWSWRLPIALGFASTLISRYMPSIETATHAYRDEYDNWDDIRAVTLHFTWISIISSLVVLCSDAIYNDFASRTLSFKFQMGVSLTIAISSLMIALFFTFVDPDAKIFYDAMVLKIVITVLLTTYSLIAPNTPDVILLKSLCMGLASGITIADFYYFNYLKLGDTFYSVGQTSYIIATFLQSLIRFQIEYLYQILSGHYFTVMFLFCIGFYMILVVFDQKLVSSEI